MSGLKCKNCNKTISNEAIICLHCGTNQLTGQVFQQRETYYKKKFLKFLQVCIFSILGFSVCAAGVFWFFLRQSKIKNIPSGQIFPFDYIETSDSNDYLIKASIKSSAKNNSHDGHGLILRVKVFAKKQPPAPLQLKIYSSRRHDGFYKEVFTENRILKKSKIKPDYPFYAKLVHKQEKFSSKQRKKRMFYRILLLNGEGDIIKEYLPVLSIPVRKKSTKSYLVRTKANEDSVYPCFASNKRSLYFDFRKARAFRSLSLEIDKVKYIPRFSQKDIPVNIKTGKTQKANKLYRSILDLDFPFGGNATVKFDVKLPEGKTKNVVLHFYLPFPCPQLRYEFLNEEQKIILFWEDNNEFFNKSNYLRLPVLSLTRNGREIRVMKTIGTGEYVINEHFEGNVVNFALKLKNGLTRNRKWTSSSGVQACRAGYKTLQEKECVKSIKVPVPAQKRCIRVELIKSNLAFENTGVQAAKLCALISNKLADEKKIIFFERSKNTVLKQAEADFAIQIRDYSRRNGKGLELFLFKKINRKIQGKNEDTTKFWRIDSSKIPADEFAYSDMVDKLIEKIEAETEIYSVNDSRSMEVQAQSIICNELKPLNQKKLLWNYKELTKEFSTELQNAFPEMKIYRGKVNKVDITDPEKRMLLLSGNIWRKNKKYSLFLKVSDAFSGQILGGRFFHGSINELARQSGEWSKSFFLYNDISSDFHSTSRKLWQVPFDYLKRYGLVFKAPLTYEKAIAEGIPFSAVKLAQAKWNDGFKLRAIAILEQEWKRNPKLDIAQELLKYYWHYKMKAGGGNLAREALRLFKNNSELKKFKRQFEFITSPSSLPDRMYCRGGKLEMLSPRGNGVFKNSDFDNMFFVDRDIICPEWCSDGKARSILVVDRASKSNIEDYLKSNKFKDIGVFIELKKLGSNTILSTLASWSSYEPFTSPLAKEIPNLFPEKYASGFAAKLYSVSKIRAILELSENLDSLNKTDKELFLKYMKKLLAETRNIQKYQLKHYLAVCVLLKEKDSEAVSFYNKALQVNVPRYKSELKSLPRRYASGDYIVFRAFRGNRRAQKYLSRYKIHLEEYVKDSDQEGFDTVFPLLNKSNADKLVKTTVVNGGLYGMYALRWAPRTVLNNIIVKYYGLLPKNVGNYLVMGYRNDFAARKWLSYKDLELYFGLPEEEIKQYLKARHLEKVEDSEQKNLW